MGEVLNLKSIENHGTVRNYSAFSSTISYEFSFLNFLIIAKLNRIVIEIVNLILIKSFINTSSIVDNAKYILYVKEIFKWQEITLFKY